MCGWSCHLAMLPSQLPTCTHGAARWLARITWTEIVMCAERPYAKLHESRRCLSTQIGCCRAQAEACLVVTLHISSFIVQQKISPAQACRLRMSDWTLCPCNTGHCLRVTHIPSQQEPVLSSDCTNAGTCDFIHARQSSTSSCCAWGVEQNELCNPAVQNSFAWSTLCSQVARCASKP